MSMGLLQHRLRKTIERLRPPESEPVRVDRDKLRTTLIQCESEVRAMRRELQATVHPGPHRVATPTCRY
ncbi:MAG: hypothetical protein K0U34_05075 [Alphaproteobacteria bacterium]|nr:hypothetical protein [Alphaproteobacteria bacterium]